MGFRILGLQVENALKPCDIRCYVIKWSLRKCLIDR